MAQVITVSERLADGSYRVKVEGDPASTQIIWGTYQYWAHALSIWSMRFQLKQVLRDIAPHSPVVEEVGCELSLYPESVVNQVCEIFRERYGMVIGGEKEMADKKTYSLIGPLVDGSYRLNAADPLVKELVWGTYRYWVKKFKLEKSLEGFKTVLEEQTTPDVSTEEEGVMQQLYPEAVAENARSILQRTREREAEQVRLKLN